MHVIGIGTDIVDARRIARVYARYGARFAEKILGPAELREFAHSTTPESFLAKRFAAKEAVSKALGSGMRGAVQWRRIEVRHSAEGQPAIALDADVAPVGTAIHLSLADEKHYATATALAVRP